MHTSQRRCPYPDCGHANSWNAAFCASCGRSLTVNASAVLPGGEEYKRSVGVAYGLWALCLAGVAGIHRFYLGRPVTGIIWLFTLGLLGLGSLYDLIVMAGMVERKNRKLAALGGFQLP